MTRRAVIAVTVAALGATASLNIRAQTADPQAGPTYSRDVAPILYKNCAGCHRPGEIGPMSLLTYANTYPWTKAIAARVSAETMPPWHADPSTGEFLNDRRLDPKDKATLLKWVANGAPEGDAKDLPAPPRFAEGWTIGQPDAVVKMAEDYPVPASGNVAYQYFEVPTNFTEDRWVQAYEVRPGNRTSVHHVIVYTRPPAPAPPPAQPGDRPARPRPQPVFTMPEDQTTIPAGQTGGEPLPDDQRKPLGPNDRPAPKMLGPSIGGYVPGNGSRVYQPGTAMRLAAGSTLIFQMHYTTNGKPTTDRTSIGFVFSKTPPVTELRATALINGALHIPAGAKDHRVDAEMTINRDVTLWAMLPHTHVRGRRWSYDVTFPDGTTQTILAVPRYDFDWQTDYVFKQPLKLPKGSKLHAAAWYDNSPSNKSNPDSTKDVWWGDQTWEEMMFTGLTFSVDPAPPVAAGAH
jgi:mono/diheme cytochrome c family protein